MKEQLKKMGSFEYHQTSFSYINNETRDERFVGVPEEGGRDLIAGDPLAPGTVYAASVSDEGKVGLYRLEVGTSPRTGKLKLAGGLDSTMKESVQRAFAYLLGHKKDFGLGALIYTKDLHVEAIDLLGTRIPCEAGVAFFVAVYSALQKRPALPALVILGDMSIQGNPKGLRTLNEPLRMAMVHFWQVVVTLRGRHVQALAGAVWFVLTGITSVPQPRSKCGSSSGIGMEISTYPANRPSLVHGIWWMIFRCPCFRMV